MGYGRSVLGVTPLLATVNSGTQPILATMAPVNNCVSFRLVGADAKIPASVWINWGTITLPGTIRIRIETDNGSGKPSGTLYDTNATVDITPALGWQQCTFASTPTTAFTVGSLYHILLITTVAGSTQTLRQSWPVPGGAYPINALAATDGSTRTNLVETGNSVPICTVVMTDTTEETFGFAAFAGASSFNIYGTRAFAMKFIVPTGAVLSILGAILESPLRNGTPDDLRVRILDSSNALVTGTSVILPRSGLLSASAKRLIGRFPAAVSLSAGTYRLVVDQVTGGGVSSTTSGNNWSFYSASHRTAAVAPSYTILSTTTDVTAGTPTWTDTAADTPLLALQLNDVSGSGGGGSYTSAANVRSGTDRGDGTVGTLVVPSAGNVLTGTTFDNGTTGTATVPTAAQVQTGITYGASGTALTGTVTLPTAAQVLVGVGFGAGGTALTGTITLPSAANVRSAITYGPSLGTTGTITLPAITDVASGVAYGAAGTEFTGTYAGGGSGLTLSQLQSELTTRGLTGTLTTYLNAGVKVQAGTSAGQINVSGGKVPATLAAADVSGNLPSNVIQVGGQTASTNSTPLTANVTQIAGQTVSASAAVTFPATVSSYAGGAVASVTGAVGSVTGSVGGNIGGNVTGNVTGSVGSVVSFGTLVSDIATAVWSATTRTLSAFSDSSGITTLLSRLSSGRATSLDNLANLDATVSSRGTSTYAGGDTAGTTTLLSRITAPRATLLDNLSNLDATVTSRLAANGYTAPDNTTITAIAGYIDTEVAAIKAKTDNLPSSPAAVGSAMTLTGTANNDIADALLDRANGILTGLTPRQAFRLFKAVMGGKRTYNPTTKTLVFMGSDGTTPALTQVIDGQGAVTSSVIGTL